MNEHQRHALRLVVATHGGCKVNRNTVRALERMGYVTVRPESPNVPRPTEAGRKAVEGAGI